MPEQHDQLFLALGRLEGKVDSILTFNTKLEEQIQAHDERIRHLEHHKHFVLGVSAIVGAGVSAIVAVLTKFVGPHP